MDVSVYDDNANPVVHIKGELVCRRAFPSQPLCFWGDVDGKKYYDTYFSRFQNVWCQGDYVELSERNTMVFYGRSDAVLNPGGVRIGTAEIYRQIETIPEVLESIAIGQAWEKDERIVLFVRLRDERKLDDGLIKLIKTTIRQNASPRHMPAKVIQVPDIPRTMSGKLVELAVKRVIDGEPVLNLDAFANPDSLEFYKNIPELTQS
jgi:acetoacetyl-CoA synthetase